MEDLTHNSKAANSTSNSESSSSNLNWGYPRFRKLSPTKAQAKRAKGICFRCDEKCGDGHQCKKKDLHVLLLSEGNKAECEGEGDIGNESELLKGVELSLNSVVGVV